MTLINLNRFNLALRPIDAGRMLAGLAAAATSLAGCGNVDRAEPNSDSVVSLRQPLSTAVFINELHYDNTGTDAGEAIEVAGAAGTDLSGYQLVLYNGATTSLGVYTTTPLAGVLANQDDGFGTLSFSYPQDGIQNGSPDGIALVGPDASVIQFLSYEGTFTAASGPAAGQLSVDIGVAETGTTPLGNSVQLTGTGNCYEDFSWATPSVASFGQVNGMQDFTPGGDVPPSVASTVPVAAAVDVAPDAAISLSFSEPVSFAGNWFSLQCTDSGDHTASVTGGPQSYVIDPDIDFALAESCTLTVFAAGVLDQDGSPEAPSADFSLGFSTELPNGCGAPAVRIHDIQGSGAESPLVGSLVVVEGIVVGGFQGPSGLGGFFVQEEDGDVDADPSTSEGLFVFEGSVSTPVSQGDIVRVRGTVVEFNGLTELDNLASVEVCVPAGSVTPVAVSLPVAAVSDLEAFEGMLVTFPQTLFASETFTWARFGEVMLSVGDRSYQPTSLAEPGSAAAALQLANDLARIQLDDGSSVQNPALPPYLGADGTLRIGDTVSGVTGVLSFSFGNYEVHPTTSVEFTRSNPREPSPADPGGNLSVASFNVLNYFTTLDDGAGDICGPSSNLECRGADSTHEFTRQRDKILAALSGMNADIVGLIEIENNPSAAIQDLVSGLNTLLGAGSYDFVDTGVIGTDAIKVGFIYKPAQVGLVGDYALLDSSVDPSFIDTSNRPVLAQTFRHLTSGEALTVVINHLKSKGSACDGDPDVGDGQGNCNLTRVAAAQAEVNWLSSDPTGSGAEDILILGDMNAYALEDPIDVFAAAGYHDLIAEFVGPLAYSFVFQGQSGYLDHALASSGLEPKVLDVREWHINADEPVALDYNTEFNPPQLYAANAFRSADHDPVLVSLELAAAPVVPSCNGLTATVYVDAEGFVVGGPLNGTLYTGLLRGGPQANVIVGTRGTDLIRGGAGSDVVCALDGNDTLLGNAGQDLLFGGEGDDSVEGGAGQDVLFGEAGNDDLEGGAGDDAIHGGDGQDTIQGGAGADQLSGDAGDDLILGNAGADNISGGDGSDSLFGGAGQDSCDGGSGTDSGSSCDVSIGIP